MNVRVESSNLPDCRSFTRGFLLAASWAGRCPEADVSERVARLEGEDLPALYREFAALPRISREALGVTWTKRERRVRLDEELDLHPSWIVDLLEHEPPVTLLLVLGELKAELSREALRTLWPRVKQAGEEALVEPLDPSRAGDLRRQLFRRFAYLPPVAARTGPMHGLIRLDPQRTWSAAQQLGRDELARVAAAAPTELGPLYQNLSPDQTALVDRLLGSNGDLSRTNVISPPNPRQPALDGTEGSMESAIERVRAVLGLAETESSAVGMIGLRVLAEALATEPRELCEQIGYRMNRPLAARMMQWRDECAARAGDPERTAAIRRRVAALCNPRPARSIGA